MGSWAEKFENGVAQFLNQASSASIEEVSHSDAILRGRTQQQVSPEETQNQTASSPQNEFGRSCAHLGLNKPSKSAEIPSIVSKPFDLFRDLETKHDMRSHDTEEAQARIEELEQKNLQHQEEIGHLLLTLQLESENAAHEIEQLQNKLYARTREFDSQIKAIQSEKKEIQTEHQSFLRRTQEEKFGEMDSWVLIEGSKLISDLDKLKRSMRAFTKKIAVTDWAMVPCVGELHKAFEEICVIRDNDLPRGLGSAKGIQLLLNALLAHHVYTSLLENPFFFLPGATDGTTAGDGLDRFLEQIYGRLKSANKVTAHNWRCETLRNLIPQQRSDMTQGQIDLSQWTSQMILVAGSFQAAQFLEGPARHLICIEAVANRRQDFEGIFQEAANLSYAMWTRKITMRCYKWNDAQADGLTFKSESPYFVAHPSVRYEEFDDKLQGRPITLMVHPILIVYGDNDGKNYDSETVWVPGEVWLDSSK